MSEDILTKREIRTERLLLRPFHGGDREDVYSYAQSEECARYLPIPHPYTLQDADYYISTQVLLDPKKELSWAIEIESRVYGGLNVRFENEGLTAEIGYCLSPSHWNMGIMTEAATAVMDWTFEKRKEVERFSANAHPDNQGSIKIFKKLGMHYEGNLRRNLKIRDELTDQVWYSILRSEWQESFL